MPLAFAITLWNSCFQNGKCLVKGQRRWMRGAHWCAPVGIRRKRTGGHGDTIMWLLRKCGFLKYYQAWALTSCPQDGKRSLGTYEGWLMGDGVLIPTHHSEDQSYSQVQHFAPSSHRWSTGVCSSLSVAFCSSRNPCLLIDLPRAVHPQPMADPMWHSATWWIRNVLCLGVPWT